MKRIYYRGVPYESLAVEMDGGKKYALYKNDQFLHFVAEEELDKKSRVSLILDAYYDAVRAEDKRIGVLS